MIAYVYMGFTPTQIYSFYYGSSKGSKVTDNEAPKAQTTRQGELSGKSHPAKSE